MIRMCLGNVYVAAGENPSHDRIFYNAVVSELKYVSILYTSQTQVKLHHYKILLPSKVMQEKLPLKIPFQHFYSWITEWTD